LFVVIISRSAGVVGVSQGVGGAWLLLLLVSGFSKEEEEEKERNYQRYEIEFARTKKMNSLTRYCKNYCVFIFLAPQEDKTLDEFILNPQYCIMTSIFAILSWN
jgi:hypothetical protein